MPAGHYTAEAVEQTRGPHCSIFDAASSPTPLKGYGETPATFDVVLVGAGMSSLYSAWRLLQANPTLKVAILDKINRTGGRLDSDLVKLGNGEEVKEEEGGMRFTFDLMVNLMSLLLIFNLVDQVVPFPMNSGGNNRLCFRGKSFNNNQAVNEQLWSQLYNLKSNEQDINPSDVPADMFDKIVNSAENAHLQPVPPPEERTPEFWQALRLQYKWDGILMKDWQLWNLCASLGYSNEFITLLYRISGFNGTYLSGMSAGEAFQLLLDFPKNPQFRTLGKGFSTLPNALVDAIGKERIWLNTNVDSVDKGVDGNISISYTRKPQNGEVYVGQLTAKHVILGLPRQAMEKLFVRSNLFNSLPDKQMKRLWNTLLTTTNQPLVKINLYYNTAWWGSTSNPKVDFGPNFSDLPLGSVYPFYSIDQELFAALEYQKYYNDRDESIPKEKEEIIDSINNGKFEKPAALTIYCDGLNVEFWKALQKTGALFNSPKQRECEGEMSAASLRVVEEATNFFKNLFNTENVPSPVLTSSRIWNGATEFDVPLSEQVGYGVHQWAQGAQDDETMKILAKPIADANVYICGEAYSDYQGWVEGALRSADLVLAQPPFGLKPISQVYEEQNGQSSTAAITAAYEKASTKRIRTYIDSSFPPKC